jgi:hypothetical protein
MNINEITNLNAPITVTATNNDGTTATSTIINLYASMDSSNMSVTIGASTIDKTQAANADNAATIKDQYSQFMAAVEAKAASLGFVVFTV